MKIKKSKGKKNKSKCKLHKKKYPCVFCDLLLEIRKRRWQNR